MDFFEEVFCEVRACSEIGWAITAQLLDYHQGGRAGSAQQVATSLQTGLKKIPGFESVAP
jgi:hypothetical protein